MESKPVSSSILWFLFQFLPPGSCLESLPWLPSGWTTKRTPGHTDAQTQLLYKSFLLQERRGLCVIWAIFLHQVSLVRLLICHLTQMDEIFGWGIDWTPSHLYSSSVLWQPLLRGLNWCQYWPAMPTVVLEIQLGSHESKAVGQRPPLICRNSEFHSAFLSHVVHLLRH